MSASCLSAAVGDDQPIDDLERPAASGSWPCDVIVLMAAPTHYWGGPYLGEIIGKPLPTTLTCFVFFAYAAFLAHPPFPISKLGLKGFANKMKSKL